MAQGAVLSTLRRGYNYLKTTTVTDAMRSAKRGVRRFGSNWSIVQIPGVLSAIPTVIKRLGTITVEGKDFVPPPLPHLMHLRESMAPVLDAYGLELVDVQEHRFQEPLREAGPISDINGTIAPKGMAQNTVAALTVKINGAETGTVENYKQVKTWIDGIGATITHLAWTVIGDVMARFGWHFVTGATEGTTSHSKPGESPIGNPTIPINTRYPARAGLELEPVMRGSKVFKYVGSIAGFLGFDVVECTEIASTSLETYQTISGREGQPKDNGAVCVVSVYDQPAILADTYARKFIVSPAIAKALRKAGKKISVANTLEQNFAIISEVTGRPVSDFAVMSLGPKPRLKDGKIRDTRLGANVLFAELDRLGIKRTLKFDDGDTPAVMLMVKKTKVEFENGERGEVDVYVGDGGVFENATAARTVADACETGDQEYAASWGYVDKKKTKDPATYFEAHNIPESSMGPYRELGITPHRSQNISKTLSDKGDRLFIVSSITDNPRLNPFAIAPQVDQANNRVTVYQEVASSDGSVVGRYITLRPKAGMSSMRQQLSPVLPDIMRIDDIDGLRSSLQALKQHPAKMDALKSNLRMYLYSLIGDSLNPDEAPYYLLMNQLLLRRHVYSLDDQKALVLLRFVTTEHPEWFVNPKAIADSKAIILSKEFDVKKDGEGNPIQVIPHDPQVLKPARV
jgi:fructose-1,6-bisphosphatase/sedoheptulose 1,7-bisphosphatase-like protein